LLSVLGSNSVPAMEVVLVIEPALTGAVTAMVIAPPLLR
jgi:hypothetical protein